MCSVSVACVFVWIGVSRKASLVLGCKCSLMLWVLVASLFVKWSWLCRLCELTFVIGEVKICKLGASMSCSKRKLFLILLPITYSCICVSPKLSVLMLGLARLRVVVVVLSL